MVIRNLANRQKQVETRAYFYSDLVSCLEIMIMWHWMGCVPFWIAIDIITIHWLCLFLQQFNAVKAKLSGQIKITLLRGNLKDFSPWLNDFQASNYEDRLEIPGK